MVVVGGLVQSQGASAVSFDKSEWLPPLCAYAQVSFSNAQVTISNTSVIRNVLVICEVRVTSPLVYNSASRHTISFTPIGGDPRGV